MSSMKVQSICRFSKDAFSYSVRYLRNFREDVADRLAGRREELTPPKRLVFSVGGNFKAGDRFLQHFIELGGLKPSDRVLDAGCGIGRMAVPLTKYLNEQGSYEGFDISGKTVNWCIKNITPRYPNFRFQLADIYNKRYNPRGRQKSSEYKFPYGDSSFDFVFLTSVFTHMLPEDVDNYLSEISRVLKPGRKCFVTFFLLNEDSSKAVEEGTSDLDFKFEADGYKTICDMIPEKAVAYEEGAIRGLFERHKLDIVGPIHYGYWCRKANYLSYQDIIIARRL